MLRSLYCKQCRVRLSSPLTMVSGKDPGVSKPAFDDCEPIVQPGVAFKSWEATPWMHVGSLSFVPQYWLNPADLTDVVQPSPIRDRMIGCCGISGFNGPNQICRCKAEIGTLQADCMTPLVFIAEPEATAWVEGDRDYWNYE